MNLRRLNDEILIREIIISWRQFIIMNNYLGRGRHHRSQGSERTKEILEFKIPQKREQLLEEPY
jgi:hypothetical protein